MIKNLKISHLVVPLLIILTAGVTAHADGETDDQSLTNRQLRAVYDSSVRYTDAITFPQTAVGNVALGRAKFGLAADDVTIDTSQALFQGTSVEAGLVVSNGTACSSCHRPQFNFLLPPTPISQNLPPGDPLITNRVAENGDDPLGPGIFDTLGLVGQRVNRFNPIRPETDPYRQIFSWRKTQTIINMAFGYGLLTDGRGREPIEQSRGATFTHTQNTDKRFDDLVNPSLPHIAAYMQTEIRPPELAALLNPSDPNYANLVANPYATVNATTKLQKKGQAVFDASCTGCHNMPNVFTNRDHLNGPPLNFPLLYGHTFDIGVAQKNKHQLEFRRYDVATGTRIPIVLPLVKEDGSTVNLTVVDDIGAAAATGRFEDLHRFKVPQLRVISQLGPYFHDNSAATLDEVVDYFNSDDYNNSKDGKLYPIHLNKQERKALLAFLNVL